MKNQKMKLTKNELEILKLAVVYYGKEKRERLRDLEPTDEDLEELATLDEMETRIASMTERIKA